jgi:hypothetical protein
MPRETYEVRVREKVGPNKWVKKSKFYEASSSGEAGKHYEGTGYVMWVERVSREKLLGVGEFFRLGDKFLKELKEEQSLPLLEKQKEKERVRRKRGFLLKRGREVY